MPKKKGPAMNLKQLQEQLIAHHYLLPKYGADGKFGPETAKALGAFLYEHDLRDNLDPLPAAATEAHLAALEKAPVMARGIDVSHWNGLIDWKQVAGSGISYAFVKAGGADGGLYKDSTFTVNFPNAQSAGLSRGAYYFYSFQQDPIAQAAHFFRLLGEVRPGDLRPALDVEDRKTPIFGAKALAHLKACLAEMERLFGVTPILYTSKGVLAAHRIDTADNGLEKYALWVPRYEVKDPSKSVPLCYQGEYAIHQVGYDDDLSGCRTEVDRNLCREPLESLMVR